MHAPPVRAQDASTTWTDMTELPHTDLHFQTKDDGSGAPILVMRASMQTMAMQLSGTESGTSAAERASAQRDAFALICEIFARDDARADIFTSLVRDAHQQLLH